MEIHLITINYFLNYLILNFKLRSNIDFGHIMLLKYVIFRILYGAKRYTCLARIL